VVKITIRKEAYMQQLGDKVERGMNSGMMFLTGRVQDVLKIGQPVRRSKSGRLIGLDPSAPGEPPHVLTGRLRQSITWAVTRTKKMVRGRVGTNVEYARRLEKGFVGTDAAGRVINQAPRPYLVSTMRNNARGILQRIFKE